MRMLKSGSNYQTAIGRTLAWSPETVNFLAEFLGLSSTMILSGLSMTWDEYDLRPQDTITITGVDSEMGVLYGSNVNRRCTIVIFLNLYFIWPAEKLEKIAA